MALQFLPVAINNSEVIAGSNETLGAVRYHNGALAGLAHINHSTGGGPYRAVDITTSGAILGIPDQLGLASYAAVTWSPPTFNPFPIGKPPVGFLEPQAMNNSQLVIGWAGDAQLAWKWSLTQGYTELKPHLPEFHARPTDVNDTGFIVGYDTTNVSAGSVLLWSPGGAVTTLDTAAGLRGFPRIRNSGEVVWANATQIKRWSAGPAVTAVAPAGLEKLTALSEAGRLAGTLKTNGVLRGWTLYQGTLSFLDPPDAQPGDYVEPTGINACGSIVGVVHRTGNPDYGVYFTRSGPVFWCDTPAVATQ
ncbi:MAG: hypothetical protein C4531_03315 [Desulfurivibrio sp.]|nr:MAG: hypothetical protein C4531_03315 [Desulfurivibrio sp.]